MQIKQTFLGVMGTKLYEFRTVILVWIVLAGIFVVVANVLAASM